MNHEMTHFAIQLKWRKLGPLNQLLLQKSFDKNDKISYLINILTK